MIKQLVNQQTNLFQVEDFISFQVEDFISFQVEDFISCLIEITRITKEVLSIFDEQYFNNDLLGFMDSQMNKLYCYANEIKFKIKKQDRENCLEIENYLEDEVLPTFESICKFYQSEINSNQNQQTNSPQTQSCANCLADIKAKMKRLEKQRCAKYVQNIINEIEQLINQQTNSPQTKSYTDCLLIIVDKIKRFLKRYKNMDIMQKTYENPKQNSALSTFNLQIEILKSPINYPPKDPTAEQKCKDYLKNTVLESYKNFLKSLQILIKG